MADRCNETPESSSRKFHTAHERERECATGLESDRQCFFLWRNTHPKKNPLPKGGTEEDLFGKKKKPPKSPYIAEKILTSPYLENRFLEVAKTKEDSKNISIFLSIRIQMRRKFSKRNYFRYLAIVFEIKGEHFCLYYYFVFWRNLKEPRKR
jgi:hypothetical protein